MKISRVVPNNKADDRCFQACIETIYEAYFGPVSSETIDRETGYTPGQMTWAFQGFEFLAKKGLFLTYWDKFDAREFRSDPEIWVLKNFGEEAASAIITKSGVVAAAQSLAKLEQNPRYRHVSKIPNISTIRSGIERGGVVLVGINSAILNRLDREYLGHFVIVIDVTAGGVILADPGLPANHSRFCSFDEFKGSWHYPNEAGAWAAVFSSSGQP